MKLIDRECLNKRRFGTEQEALETAKGAFTALQLRAYPCPHCGFYHLTKQPLKTFSAEQGRV